MLVRVGSRVECVGAIVLTRVAKLPVDVDIAAIDKSLIESVLAVESTILGATVASTIAKRKLMRRIASRIVGASTGTKAAIRTAFGIHSHMASGIGLGNNVYRAAETAATHAARGCTLKHLNAHNIVDSHGEIG